MTHIVSLRVPVQLNRQRYRRKPPSRNTDAKQRESIGYSLSKGVHTPRQLSAIRQYSSFACFLDALVDYARVELSMPLRDRKYEFRKIDTADRSPRKSSREERLAGFQQALLKLLPEQELSCQDACSHPLDQIRQALTGRLAPPRATNQRPHPPGE